MTDLIQTLQAMTQDQYLRLAFQNWTTSKVYSPAWKYANDFEGFVKWFTSQQSEAAQ